MTEDKKIKRVSLYFNLDIESEAKMWEYLEGKKKSYEIKKSLEISMSKDISPAIKYSDEISINGPEFKVLNNISESEIDIEGIEGF